ncbi:MAG: hypothetical protein DHS20C21_04090 [Gemmatimonadota bacterium]|nr:MAG: hypothetical protein DHS20C21_04090 [Gemmatimonadota bacterium]
MSGAPGVPTPDTPSLADQRPGERGSVLIIALVMLVIFTLVGSTFLSLATTEGRISTNLNKDVQSLFVAESGAQIAYESMAFNNFQSFTHQADGTPTAPGSFTPIPMPGNPIVLDVAGDQGLDDERDDGQLVWQWKPGDAGAGLTNTGLTESFRFSVRPASAAPLDPTFVIDIEGSVGGRYHERLQVMGTTEPVFNYALFADGPLSEFTRGKDQHITGKVHANGDLYFRPWNPNTLSIDSPAITATGKMIRTTDIFGRDLYSGSTVLIKNRAGTYVEMDLGTPGNAMDSENANWANDDPTDGIDGAVELWDGIVRDGALGATHVAPPPVETIDAGGWYNQRATLRLTSGDTQTDQYGSDISSALGSVVTEKTFYNYAIQDYVTVQEIDMAALNASGHFPPNGLLYSDVPIRIVNGDELAGDLTIVSAHSVYTKGDFNSTNKRPAAIISKGRVWHVSDAWSDADSYTTGGVSGRQAANGTTTINAAIVDGPPAMNTAQFADIDGDGQPDDPSAGNAIENADALLESWGGSRTLKKYGSIVHLQNADMADDPRNSGIAPHEVAWIRKTAYAPPTRDYSYDPSLAGMSGQPPFTPMTGRIFLWQQITL